MPAEQLANELTVADIEQEILRGLPSSEARRTAGFDNLQFYLGNNIAYIDREESEEFKDFVNRPKRCSRLTRKAIETLTRHLYHPGPSRKIEASEEADAMFQQIYRTSHINELMRRADAYATLNSVAAIQIAAMPWGSPNPVRYHLLTTHQFIPFFEPENPFDPIAVVTVDLEFKSEEKRKRFELWTPEVHRCYYTKWAKVSDTSGSRLPYLLRSEKASVEKDEANPYGVLPFVFVHDAMPVTDFFDGGIGTQLREANLEIDRALSQLANHVKKHLDPRIFGRNLPADWRDAKRTGSITPLPPGVTADGDAADQPDVFALTLPMAVEQAWFDVKTFMDVTFEDLDVPLTYARTDASTDLSGVAIVAKQIPLLDRVGQRQKIATVWEEELVKTTAIVLGNYHGIPGLLEIADDPKLNLSWPQPRFPLPTPERDAEDEFEINMGVLSTVELVMRRRGCTREQAIEALEQIAADNEIVKAMFPEAQLAGEEEAAAEETGEPGGAEPEPEEED